MKNSLIALPAALLMLISFASATIINIPEDYATIRQGIYASADGDTVLVQPGIYVENINFNGHNIVLGSLFLTTEDTSYILLTVIDGDSSGSVVTFENGEDSTAIIIGMCIQNGCDIQGGGIYCAGSNPKILNNYICNNWAYSDTQGACSGGGVYCYNSHPLISGNQIFGNRTRGNSGMDRGGGISCRESSPKIIGNSITDNHVYGIFGGGIHCYPNSNPTITKNLIDGNTASDGGGIACTEASPMINSNLIVNNHAASWGGGILSVLSSTPLLYNNIVAYNSSDIGGGIYNWEDCNGIIINNTITGNVSDSMGGLYSSYSTPYIINNIIWGNDSETERDFYFGSAVQSYNLLNSYWPGDGNMIADPAFRDPDNGDFHLLAIECGDPYDSPCIDRGHPGIVDTLLDCDWGLGGVRSDIGAFGGGDSITVGIINKREFLPDIIRLFQNYPNPFNASTLINYTLPEQEHICLEIYNILGQRVVTLYDGVQPAGEYSLIWDASDQPSGIYFARLSSQNRNESIKMLLLK